MSSTSFRANKVSLMFWGTNWGGPLWSYDFIPLMKNAITKKEAMI